MELQLTHEAGNCIIYAAITVLKSLPHLCLGNMLASSVTEHERVFRLFRAVRTFKPKSDQHYKKKPDGYQHQNLLRHLQSLHIHTEVPLNEADVATKTIKKICSGALQHINKSSLSLQRETSEEPKKVLFFYF